MSRLRISAECVLASLSSHCSICSWCSANRVRLRRVYGRFCLGSGSGWLTCHNSGSGLPREGGMWRKEAASSCLDAFRTIASEEMSRLRFGYNGT